MTMRLECVKNYQVLKQLVLAGEVIEFEDGSSVWWNYDDRTRRAKGIYVVKDNKGKLEYTDFLPHGTAKINGGWKLV
jgi:hypothetical protein